MPTEATREEVRKLLAGGAQLVEVLPRGEYEEEHLRGAINMPLMELTTEIAGLLEVQFAAGIILDATVCSVSRSGSRRRRSRRSFPRPESEATGSTQQLGPLVRTIAASREVVFRHHYGGTGRSSQPAACETAGP